MKTATPVKDSPVQVIGLELEFHVHDQLIRGHWFDFNHNMYLLNIYFVPGTGVTLLDKQPLPLPAGSLQSGGGGRHAQGNTQIILDRYKS